MRRVPTIFAVFAIIFQAGCALGFGIPTTITTSVHQQKGSPPPKLADRRDFFRRAGGALAIVIGSSSAPHPLVASAGSLPSITVTEFQEIIRDSAKSIQVVEFSGPKSETANAKLVDGTVFEISGLVDSPSDPRSPLKLAAICRASKIPTKFLTLELAISASGSKKKKSYANTRVQEAAQKEREKKARMEADEQQRLAELYQLEEAEAAKKAVAVAAAETQ